MPTPRKSLKYLEFDSPWKDIIALYFQPFLEFFFPLIASQIDWSKGYEFLDKELQKVVRDAVTQSRRVDKLVKVFLQSGEVTILYIHIEIQGQVETEFAQRMFIYHYRLYDRYGAQVMSVALLGDNKAEWCPQHYGYERFGCSLSFNFPIVKLLDYRARWAELERDTNPFALIVRVHLKGLETQRKPNERYYWKVQLFKALYEANYRKEEILALFRFLDWVLILPQALEQEFSQFTHDYEEAKTVRYVTSVERLGMQKGMAEGLQKGMRQGLRQGKQEGIKQGSLQQAREAVIEVLRARFARLPNSLLKKIQRIEQVEVLSQLLKKSAVVESLESFEQQLQE